MSLWSILAAPLLAGNDLRNMTPAILEILTNREVIAVNQDKLANRAGASRNRRPGSMGEGAFRWRASHRIINRGGAPAKITVKWTDLGMKSAPASARDLWAHGDLKLDGAEYSVTVPAHGVMMLKIAASSDLRPPA